MLCATLWKMSRQLDTSLSLASGRSEPSRVWNNNVPWKQKGTHTTGRKAVLVYLVKASYALTPPNKLTRPRSVQEGQYHASCSVWISAASLLWLPAGRHLRWKALQHMVQPSKSPP